MGGPADLTPVERGALAEVEPGRWDDLIRDLGVTDVYYARAYVESAAALTGGEPAYLHLAGDGGDVLFCGLVRSDPADVVTPYGYGGPLGVGAAPPLTGFAAAYGRWCERRGVVSSFVAYHPLFANQRAGEATGFHVLPLHGTVAWELGDDPEAGMHRHHRRLVRRARAQGLTAVAEPAPADLEEFAAVYDATMRRAGASDFYFFGADYWERLLAGVPLVRVDVRGGGGELAASVLGMGEPPWLHYHLGGSTAAGRRAGASHLALLGLAAWGHEHGYEMLHLGGGVGGREDSLFEYKLRFAPEGRRDMAVGKAVHDLGRYEALTGAPGVDWDGFFPAYRAPR